MPGGDALLGLGCRLAVEGRFERGGEIVPEGDVSRLLRGVLRVASERGCVCERDDRVTVLACIEGELLAGQLTALPTQVEGMVEDVPAAPGVVDSLDQVRRSMPATALARASSSKR